MKGEKAEFGHFLVNYLFHSKCLLCEAPLLATSPLCPACARGLVFERMKRCGRCGRELSEALTEPVCRDCAGRRSHYDELAILGTWGEKLQKLIHGLKFKERHSVAALLADCLIRTVDPSFFLVDYLIPVPLHWKRLKERGYNQSQLILDRVGRRLRIPVLPHGLERVRNTKPQSLLRRDERVENIKGAFGPGRQAGLLNGKRVLLFDDVMTTGSTLDEAARALKTGSPSILRAMAVARAE